MSGFHNCFISYGRADSKAFAHKLYQHLADQGLDIWFDFEDIPLGVDFQNQIDDGIEKADNFVFVIAPHSINSPYCRKEIELALKCQKRIIPLLHVEQVSYETWKQRYPHKTDADWQDYQAKGLHSSFPNMHPAIGKINWVYFREGIDDFEKSLAGLLQIFERHKTYVRNHTHFLAKALEWERNQQQSRYLLAGEDCQQAEDWLKVRFKGEQPPCTPTNLHCEYITESIKNSNSLMTQVFLSYANLDKAAMEKMRNSLRRSGFTVWSNTTDVQTGEPYEKALQRGIEQANNVVYLLSPDALTSEYSQQELNYAASLNKRIIPVQVQPTDPQQLPDALKSLQCIELTDNVKEEDYNLDEGRLIKLLNQDADYYQEHKVLLVKALNWQRQNQNPSILLRGYMLRHAEAWLKTAKHRRHPPTAIQEDLITASLQQPSVSVLDVFISYSPADADLANQLNDALQMQGKTTWFDQENIPADANKQQEIYQGIESSGNILFILSPRSIQSADFKDEVDHAASLNKRLVTVLHREVNSAELPPALANVPWIDFNQSDSDFATTFSQLVRTLDTDREHVHNHTKWSQQALEWEANGRDKDLLLRGSEFALAQAWLQVALEQNKQPVPTSLQQTFVEESHRAILTFEEAEKQRQAELVRLQEEKIKEAEARLLEEKKSARRQKMFLGAVSVGFVIATILGVVAISSQQEATRRKQEAQIASAEALVTSADALYVSNRKLDALVQALLAKQVLKDLKGADADLEKAANGTLQQAVFGVREYNRLSGIDGHQATVLTVAISPDGQLIASGSEDNTIKLWKRDGTLLKTLTGHHDSINAIAFSPDGTLIASASVDKTITLWNRDGILQRKLDGHDAEVTAVAFSPDGTLIASASKDKTIKLWTVDGTLITTMTGHTDGVKSIAFSPNGTLIASAGKDQTIKLWRMDGTLITSWTGHEDEVNSIAFSADGEQIASASDDRTVKLWTLDGTLIKTLIGHRSPVTAVAFSPDGQTIASSSWDRTIRLWSADGILLATLAGHRDKVTGVAFSADGETIASASEDNTVKLWKRDERFLKTLFRHYGAVNAVAISPDGMLIASASDDRTVNLWQQDGTLQKTLSASGRVRTVEFSPDSQIIAAGSMNKTIRLWKQDGSLLLDLEDTDRINHIAFSPDGELLASASDDHTIKLWRWRDRTVVTTLKGHTDMVQSVAFSPDGQLIVSGSSDNTIKLWSRSGKLISTVTAHNGRVSSVSFSPDGQLIVSASVDNTIKLWKRDGGALTLMHIFGEKGDQHAESVTEVVFSWDGNRIASASVDQTVKLWDLEGKLLNTFYVHTDAVNDIAFSRDDQTIASASNDNTVLLWKIDQVLETENLQKEGCALLQDYLKTNTEEDKVDLPSCNGNSTL